MQRLLAAALALAAGTAGAEDRALILANQDYRDAADISAAGDVLEAAEALRANGFSVTASADLTAPAMRVRLSEFVNALTPGDRLVLIVAAHVAHSDSETWLLGTEADSPDLAQVGGVAVSLATLLDIAATAPGGAAVLIGTEAADLTLGTGLQQGVGGLAIPQGVGVIVGEASGVAALAAGPLAERGTSLAQMVAGDPDLTAQGFLPADLPFRPLQVAEPAPVAPDTTEAERAAEAAAFAQARALGTPEALDAFVLAWPEGANAATARTEAARLRADPVLRAQRTEDALALTRDQRRAIQRQLSLLGFNPRGIDGVFGPGSRAAIAAWQTANSDPVSGYLTRDQTLRLAALADRRAAELEAEAAARKAEQDRQDRGFWDQTGAAGDEAGLRTYLRQYPDGLFAELATERLKVIEDRARAEAEAQDRAAWDAALAQDTVPAYRAYLAAWPQGAFAAEAQTRIDRVESGLSPEDLTQAEATEAGLALNGLSRSLIEERLAQLDFDPGERDGVFDDRTRRAIRRFQAARDMAETGYIDQSSMVALLAGGVLRLGD